ncbi:hypothetical protein Q7M_1354 (plasmid) [Borrelia crocidurae str. Achema]|uniref:Uncharacterized protein n=1 Tax=Borrelia crocidurae (strain Achema) TaxID=1155096 RepID=I0FF54_BORCA|nr:hypothetical protein Q7M_1354 [Borrelia crocidurae str. Achema]
MKQMQTFIFGGIKNIPKTQPKFTLIRLSFKIVYHAKNLRMIHFFIIFIFYPLKKIIVCLIKFQSSCQ